MAMRFPLQPGAIRATQRAPHRGFQCAGCVLRAPPAAFRLSASRARLQGCRGVPQPRAAAADPEVEHATVASSSSRDEKPVDPAVASVLDEVAAKVGEAIPPSLLPQLECFASVGVLAPELVKFTKRQLGSRDERIQVLKMNVEVLEARLRWCV